MSAKLEKRYYITPQKNGLFTLNDRQSKWKVVYEDGTRGPSYGITFNLTLERAEAECEKFNAAYEATGK